MEIGVVLALMAGLGSVGANGLEIFRYDVTPLKNESFEWVPSRKLYGGFGAAEGQFKFMVYVLVAGGFCSASLIKANWVLLAAHCLKHVQDLREVLVVAGKTQLIHYMREKFKKRKQSFIDKLAVMINEQKHGVKEGRVKKIVRHPNFNIKTLEHDIAVMLLEQSLAGKNIKIIPISLEKMNEPMLCTILGWGLKPLPRDPFLLHYSAGKVAGPAPKYCLLKSKRYSICLKMSGTGVCQGDSGSPLVCNGKVWGVCSHGVSNKRRNRTCGSNLEEYYAELYPEIKWLKAVMNGAERRATSLSGALLWACRPWLTSAGFEVQGIREARSRSSDS